MSNRALQHYFDLVFLNPICVRCNIGFDKSGKPIRPRMVRKKSSASTANAEGPDYWYCNECKGYYGECE